ncbi:MAG: flagellar biosynthesis repressor FlbT [Rhodospirillales bacterium]|nr:flagellar biosynthesis repressor FlbT [Rhodospirillales bacterium]
MPLNISLKPRERLVVNGAVIRNKSARHPLTIELLNKVNFMREREILMPEDALTPLLRVMYWLQITYIDPDQRDDAQLRFLELVREIKDAVSEPSILSAVDAAVAFVGQDQFGSALKALRDALPHERRLLGMNSEASTSVVAAMRNSVADARA